MIGIVACSAEGAALCYRSLCVEAEDLFGPYGHPEIALHAHSFAQYVERLERGDWAGVGELMLSSARKLAAIGARFLICPDNTIHRALPRIEKRLPLPWLHIAGVVAAQAAERGYRRVGLMGTRWLVESEVYPEKLAEKGIECVRLELEERRRVERIIMDELVRSVVEPGSVAELQRVVAQLARASCDAVVLGCTELPLVLDDASSPLPTLDSTRLLARAALSRALECPH